MGLVEVVFHEVEKRLLIVEGLSPGMRTFEVEVEEPVNNTGVQKALGFYPIVGCELGEIYGRERRNFDLVAIEERSVVPGLGIHFSGQRSGSRVMLAGLKGTLLLINPRRVRISEGSKILT